MERKLHWYEHIPINIYWLGLNIASGTITPILLPYLVLLFVPEDQKNTYLATVRVIGLAVAMLIQPLAGMLSDRSTSKWGRRRPFILLSAVLNTVFLLMLASSTLFRNVGTDAFFQSTFGIPTAFVVLLGAIVLLQFSSNIGQGAVQGLMPDLVPEKQRGISSGVKSIMELLPVFLVMFIGPLVGKGQVWTVVGIISGGFLLTMLVTVLFAREKPAEAVPATTRKGEAFWRLLALTVIFVGITRVALWLVTASGGLVQNASLQMALIIVGGAGLLGMAGSIFIGVYFGAWVGIGKEARTQKSFIWWVINRLLFLAAVGSIQGFAQYFLREVLQVPNAPATTSTLLAVVGLFLLPSALGGGWLSDRIGKKRLVMIAGFIAAAGAFLLLFSKTIPLVMVAGAIIGLGTGTFYAANWALGTELAPKQEAGKYLGISNLAGAGAGIVGAGIGGPMADFFNQIQPGLGYLVIFAIYGGLFLLSVVALTQVKSNVK